MRYSDVACRAIPLATIGMRRLAFFIVISVLAAACLWLATAHMAHVVYVFSHPSDAPPGRSINWSWVGWFLVTRGLLPTAAALAGVTVGVTIALRRSLVRSLRSLALFSAALGLFVAGTQLPVIGLIASMYEGFRVPLLLRADPGSALAEWSAVLGVLSVVIIIVSLLDFSVTYGQGATECPSGHQTPSTDSLPIMGWRRWLTRRWVRLLVVLTSMILGVLLAPAGVRGDAAWLAFALYPALLISLASMWSLIRSGTPEVSARVTWIFHGVAGLALAVPLYLLAGRYLSMSIRPLPLTAGALFATYAVAYAVFFGGAAGPQLVIRRATVYGALGAIFLFLFAGFGNVAEGFVEGSLGLPGGIGPMVTGGVLALAMFPLKKRMDRFVNRILPATVLAESPTHIAAILFSDIVGYTRLTGEEQKTALTVMSVFHKAADRVARENRGRLVKTVADEVVLEFKDVQNAVMAASDLLDEFHESAEKLDMPTPELRTGVHFGEVTRAQDGDLFGDTVNIASRLQGIAEPGQIVLSAAVAEQVSDFELEPLGPQELKNVTEPVECYGLTGEEVEPS